MISAPSHSTFALYAIPAVWGPGAVSRSRRPCRDSDVGRRAHAWRYGRHDSLEAVGHPPMCGELLILGWQAEFHSVGVEVIEQTLSLMLLGIEPGESDEPA